MQQVVKPTTLKKHKAIELKKECDLLSFKDNQQVIALVTYLGASFQTQKNLNAN